jgi:hypothetical protein
MTQLSNLGAEIDLLIQQGADLALDLAFSDTTVDPPTPKNIGGCILRAQVRKSAASPIVLATFATEITDGPNGLASISLASTDTAELTAGDDQSDPLGTYYYSLEFVEVGGSTSVPVFGSLQVVGSVTRP